MTLICTYIYYVLNSFEVEKKVFWEVGWLLIIVLYIFMTAVGFAILIGSSYIFSSEVRESILEHFWLVLEAKNVKFV